MNVSGIFPLCFINVQCKIGLGCVLVLGLHFFLFVLQRKTYCCSYNELHLYNMTIQNPVYVCKNVHLTTVTNIGSSQTRHVHHKWQLSKRIVQLLEDRKSNNSLIEPKVFACISIWHLLALDFFTTLKPIAGMHPCPNVKHIRCIVMFYYVTM